MATVPWDPLVPVLIEALRSQTEAREQAGIGVLVRAVHVLPLLCTDARDHS